MIVAFRADGSPRIGLGHVARCSALAHELSRRGIEIRFVSRDPSPLVGVLLKRAGVDVIRLPRKAVDHDETDADETSALVGSVDWMVVDHYGFGAPWELRILERCAERLLVIEDLFNRPHEAHVLVDQNLDAPDRRDLLPTGARQLRGPMFALLRPEFHRTVPPERSQRRGVLVSLGGGDDGGATVALVEALLRQAPELPLDVVTTSSSTDAGRLRAMVDALPEVSVHVDTAEMATLMARAELMVGAAGSTSWERCALGLPSLTVSMVTNQESTAVAVARRRATIHAGLVTDVSFSAVAATAVKMLSRPSLLARMGARAQTLSDGRGASRVADLLSGSTVL